VEGAETELARTGDDNGRKVAVIHSSDDTDVPVEHSVWYKRMLEKINSALPGRWKGKGLKYESSSKPNGCYRFSLRENR